jgi:dTDP-4-amino-4,6-dideoxygalactose transaminase
MIPHSKPTIGTEETAAVQRVMESGQLAQGREVQAFEEECGAFVGRKFAVAVSSGTAALHLVLAAFGVDSNTRVALPAYACASLATAVMLQGGVSYLCDVEADYNLAPKAIPDSIDISIVPHLFGKSAVLPASGRVIEDIAQSIGGDTGCGSIVSIGSFYATKMMTTGEGGMVFTDDEGLAEFVHDRRDYDNRDDLIQRFAYKMTDMQAAMGRIQLRKLPEWVKRRRELADRYLQGLTDLPVDLPDSDDHVFFRFVLGCDVQEALISSLQAAGIDAKRPVYQPAHAGVANGDKKNKIEGADHYPGAESAHTRGVSLPIYPLLNDDQAQKIIESVRAFYV